MRRRFEFSEGGSNKFWEIEQQGLVVTTWWGRMGTAGQSKTKDFGTEGDARKEYDKLVAEKTKKGYTECGGTSPAVPAPALAAVPTPATAAVPSSPKVAAVIAAAVEAMVPAAPVAVLSPPTSDDVDEATSDVVADLRKEWDTRTYSVPVYLRTGLPLDAIASKLNIPVRDVQQVVMIRALQDTPDIVNLMQEFNLQLKDLMQLRKWFMRSRTKYVWLLRNATITDEEFEFVDYVVACTVARANPMDTGSLMTKFGATKTANYLKFYRMLVQALAFEQESVFSEIERSGYLSGKYDPATLAQQRVLIKSQLEAATAMAHAQDPSPAPTAQGVEVSEAVRNAFDAMFSALRLRIESYVPTGSAYRPAIAETKDIPECNAVFALPENMQAEAVMLGLAILAEGPKTHTLAVDYNRYLLHDLVQKLHRKRLPYTTKQLCSILLSADKAYDGNWQIQGAGIVAMVEQHLGEGVPSPELSAAIDSFRHRMSQRTWNGGPTTAERRLVHRLEEIVARTGDDTIRFQIGPGDAWSDYALAQLRSMNATAQRAWKNLVDHCLETSSTKPSATWIKKAKQLVSEIGNAEFEAAVTEWFSYVPKKPDELNVVNVEILKGLAWVSTGIQAPAFVAALGDAAESCFKKVVNIGPRCPKLGNACVHVLAEIGTKEAIAQLTRVQAKAKHSSVKNQIEKALGTAANRSNMTVEDLQDLGVPETVEKPAELEKLLTGLRARIERSYIEQRHWRFVDFRERYIDHPITGTLARRLLWNFNGRTAIYENGRYITLEGEEIQPEDNAIVELWHPISAEPSVVLGWRKYLADLKIVQPFKQCHREIYVLTDAERETGTYSNRFAGHILRQHQFAHLAHQRNWQYRLMGGFDSHNTPYLVLPKWDLTAELWMDCPEGNEHLSDHAIYTIVFTEQLCFHRTSAAENTFFRSDQRMPLTEIMPIVFSEVMRDVDLFVSVCSIGVDPDIAQGAHAGYWTDFSFGDLNAMGHTRKQVLQDIIPVLALGSRCSFQGNFLVVRGDIRTYKIHIGSGKIQMEPNSEYLCIVEGRSSRAPGVRSEIFLPFEGDHTLAVILSKAAMLADDTKIKDSSIVSQIRRGIPG